MKDIGVGVIGLGMGQSLIAVNGDPSSRLEVRAVCAATEARARGAAERHGIPFWTTDHRALVNRPEVDVVGVYSPDHLHAEHVLAALAAGKHVVCTKPLVTTMEDCRRIVRAVRDSGKKLLVGHTMRFDTEFQNVHRLVGDGDLGPAIFAEAHYVHDLRGLGELTPWRFTAPQDLMFGGVAHPVDALRWLLGEIDEVHCYGLRSGMLKDYPLDDTFTLNLRFKCGAVGRVLGLYGVVDPPVPMMGVAVFGRHGSVRAEYTDLKGGRISLVLDKTQGRPTFCADVPPVTHGALGHGGAVAKYMRHLEECLTKDLEPTPGAVDGARTIAVCVAAHESMRLGRAVRVETEF